MVGRINIVVCFSILLLINDVTSYPTTKEETKFMKENNEKKGTIRIQGPWHSESALDRNVDPAEDSYVKKIISTNEGINFNKDMAEAGEMFDVNGIEDFYDKNAMITYEINGHEIPVHMKPKLTPQSKSLFPEYVRETPAAMGMTRQSLKNGLHLHNSQKLNTRVENPFAGFTSKDMPEYNVHESPELHDGNKYSIEVHNFMHNHALQYDKGKHEGLRLPWKTADSSGQVNRPTEHSKQIQEIGENQIEPSHEFFNAKVTDGNSHNGGLKKVKYFHYKDDTGIQSAEPSTKHIEEQRTENNPISHLFHKHYNHENDDRENEHNNFIKASSEEKEMLHHSLENPEKDMSDTSKFHHGIFAQHLNGPARNEEELPHHPLESSESNSLFAKLEDLHKKLASSNSNHEQSETATINDSDKTQEQDPEKAKAKTRILSLLGELSTKLKGMEAAVTGHHLTKSEQFQNHQEDIQDTISSRLTNNIESHGVPMFSTNSHEHSDTSSSSPENLVPQHSGNSHSSFTSTQSEPVDQAATGRETFQKGTEDVPDHNGMISEDSSLRTNNDHNKNIEEVIEPSKENFFIRNAEKEKQAFAMAEQKEKDKEKEEEVGRNINKNYKKLEEDSSAEESFHSLASKYKQQEKDELEKERLLPDAISKYREEDKPFVMDTDAIDYKPTKTDKILTLDENDEDETSKIEHHNKHISKIKHDTEEGDDETPHHHKEGDDEVPQHHEEGDNEAPHHHEHISKSNHKNKHHRNSFHDHFHKEKKNEDAEHDDDEEEESNNKQKEKVKSEAKESEVDDKEKKVDDITESLASADEHDSGLTRERTYRPKIHADDIEYPDYNDVKDAAIFESNLLRKKFHAKKIFWSDKLSDKAQQSAEKIAKNTQELDKLEKQPGENVAFIKIASPNVGKDAIDKWASEAKNYDFKSPLITKKSADFVQLMWKADKEFGMGVAKSRDEKEWIVTSFFDTPYIDKFQDLRLNVQSDVPTLDPYGDIVG